MKPVLVICFALSLMACQRIGCLSPDATNYDQQANSEGVCEFKYEIMFWFSETTMATIVDSLNISKYDYIIFDYENSNQLPFGCTLEHLKYYEPTYYEFQGSACRNSIKINHHQSTGGDFEMKYKMYAKSFNDTTIILTGTTVLKPNQKPMVELLFN